jgi:hypothetical protein
LVGVIAHVGSGFGAQPAYVLGELTACSRCGVRVDDASVIAEDEHTDTPRTEAGTGEQASREQFDVVTMGADEQDPFGEVHAGFRATYPAACIHLAARCSPSTSGVDGTQPNSSRRRSTEAHRRHHPVPIARLFET